MTPELLAHCTGSKMTRAVLFAPHLSVGMAFYGIDTPARQAAFLAQIGHETMSLRHTAEIWGPTSAQLRYERDFTAPWPADLAESRMEQFETNRLAWTLGNTRQGDGERYKGHGLIQTTGRANHARVRDRLRERFPGVPDFELDPEELMVPQWAALSACDYWDWKGLNALADAGQFKLITKRINGGITGLADRTARHNTALEALA